MLVDATGGHGRLTTVALTASPLSMFRHLQLQKNAHHPSVQNSGSVPQKPNCEQQTFNGHLSCPGAEPSPHSASASQLEVQLPPFETSVQKSPPKPQSPELPLQHAPCPHANISVPCSKQGKRSTYICTGYVWSTSTGWKIGRVCWRTDLSCDERHRRRRGQEKDGGEGMKVRSGEENSEDVLE